MVKYKVSTPGQDSVILNKSLGAQFLLGSLFRNLAPLPISQETKWMTNDKVWGAQDKGVGGTGEGCKVSECSEQSNAGRSKKAVEGNLNRLVAKRIFCSFCTKMAGKGSRK
jgi:hypothetical protein